MSNIFRNRIGLFIIAALICCGDPSLLTAQEKKLHFLIVSDMGGFASENQQSVARAMGQEAERTGAAFVVTAGDNYHESGIASENDPRWKTEFEDIYKAPSLQIPWYPTLGNHDYRGSVDAEIAYSRISPRWKLPARYYAQTAFIDSLHSVLIVHIDTPPFIEEYRMDDKKYHVAGQDTKRQLLWIDSVLQHSSADWKIVVGHHPVYSAAPKHGDTQELIDQLLPILTKNKVDAYVCGHDHILQHLKRGGINYIICGGGAGFREVSQRNDVVFGVGSLGFVSVAVSARQCHFSILNSEMKVLHSIELSK